MIEHAEIHGDQVRLFYHVYEVGIGNSTKVKEIPITSINYIDVLIGKKGGFHTFYIYSFKKSESSYSVCHNGIDYEGRKFEILYSGWRDSRNLVESIKEVLPEIEVNTLKAGDDDKYHTI